MRIECEWGLRGLKHLLPAADVVIIVDVLSFSTAVDVAVDRGGRVYPYPQPDDELAEFARGVDAELAGRRGECRYSLSPRCYEDIEPGTRIVLPSPNGATLSRNAGDGVVFTGCLRNASAVAEAASSCGRTIAVIPSGERWPEGTLRPALEDWLGAGAIIRALEGDATPEARAAALAFTSFEPTMTTVLRECMSGRELVDRGYEGDVVSAAALDASGAVPVLTEGAYTAYRG
jgi:2-phosphosulfolactate phosphatase